MRYTAEETAEKHRRLVEVAANMMRKDGLDGVSISEVMKAAGMTHGAFYSHFKTKEEMAEEALAWVSDKTDSATTETITTAAEPLAALLKSYLSTDHRDNTAAGCTIATMSIEAGRKDFGRGVLTMQIKRWVQKLADGIKWKKNDANRNQAILTVSAMVGGLILARTVNDEILSDEIMAVLREELGRLE